MNFESSLFLAISIGAACVFAVTVAYGQWVTRDLNTADAAAPAEPRAAKTPVAAPARSGARVYEEAL